MRLTLRILGLLLGIFLPVLGIFLLFEPVRGGTLEKVNAITFIAVGTVFLIYGFKGNKNSDTGNMNDDSRQHD